MTLNTRTLTLIPLILLAGCTSPHVGKDVDSIRVTASGCWTGALDRDGATESVAGCGNQTWTASGGIVSVSFQKKAADSGSLCATLLHAGATVKRSCTTADYGIASAAA